MQLRRQYGRAHGPCTVRWRARVPVDESTRKPVYRRHVSGGFGAWQSDENASAPVMGPRPCDMKSRGVRMPLRKGAGFLGGMPGSHSETVWSVRDNRIDSLGDQTAHLVDFVHGPDEDGQPAGFRAANEAGVDMILAQPDRVHTRS